MAHVTQHPTNDMTMKKASASSRDSQIRSEYRFDYTKSRPNRFAQRMSKNTVAVVLEPDVASVFKTSTSVNRTLRNALKAKKRASKKKAG